MSRIATEVLSSSRVRRLECPMLKEATLASMQTFPEKIHEGRKVRMSPVTGVIAMNTAVLLLHFIILDDQNSIYHSLSYDDSI